MKYEYPKLFELTEKIWNEKVAVTVKYEYSDQNIFTYQLNYPEIGDVVKIPQLGAGEFVITSIEPASQDTCLVACVKKFIKG